MANVKISQLPGADAALGTQEFEVNESGSSKKVTGSQISTYVRGQVVLGDLGITATASEINKLDGVTASTAELNILDGVTATTAELNILDGVTATAAELNILDGVTATTAELNHVDGVTSNIQTQLDGKQASLGFTPVQQGGGTGQGANKVYIGWTGSQLALQVDSTNFGANWPINANAPTTAQVLSATAGASAGAVGTYAFLRRSTTTTTVDFGTTIAGSSLIPAGLGALGWATSNNLNGAFAFAQNSTQSGTWRSMGHTRYFSTGEEGNITGATLWLRIS